MELRRKNRKIKHVGIILLILNTMFLTLPTNMMAVLAKMVLLIGDGLMMTAKGFTHLLMIVKRFLVKIMKKDLLISATQ